MKLEGEPAVTDWSNVPPVEQSGEAGGAIARTHQFGDVQLRRVSYRPNYIADHWCQKGHIVFVLDGQLTIEHENGRRYELAPGMSYHVGDHSSPHRVISKNGASLFIVD